MTLVKTNEDRDTYLQCPYCEYYKVKNTNSMRVPKSVGKYRIMVIHKTIFKFTCSRCAKSYKMIMGTDKKYLWTKMTRKEREVFKKEHYKGGKKK